MPRLSLAVAVVLPFALSTAAAAQAPPATPQEPPPAAQGRGAARVQVEFGLGAGRLEHDTVDSGRDGKADAGFAQLQIEAFADSGFGGGLRLEAIGSDSGLLDEGGVPRAEGRIGELFVHMSYLVELMPTELPVRVGVLFHENELELPSIGAEERYGTFGLRFEAEPRIRLIRDGDFELDLFTQVGVGFGWTDVEFSNSPVEFEAGSSFFGVEAGLRAQIGPVTVGLAYVNRSQSMDDSEREGGAFVQGFDSTFDGVMLTFGAVF